MEIALASKKATKRGICLGEIIDESLKSKFKGQTLSRFSATSNADHSFERDRTQLDRRAI